MGEFLQRRDTQASTACCWCQAPRESVEHLLFKCQKWWRQCRTLRGDLIQAKVQYPTAAEEIPEARLFGDRKATKALLAFVATTGVGAWGEQQRECVRAQRDDEWGLEEVEEREQEGER